MTGYADQRERARGLDALIRDVIANPFSLPDIRKAVNEALVAKGRAPRCSSAFETVVDRILLGFVAKEVDIRLER